MEVEAFSAVFRAYSTSEMRVSQFSSFVGVNDMIVIEVTTTRVEGTLFLDVLDVVVVLVTTIRVEGALSVEVVDVIIVVIIKTTTYEGRGVVVLTTVNIDTDTEMILVLALLLEEALAVEVSITVVVETGTEVILVLALLLEEALAVKVEKTVIVVEPVLFRDWLGSLGWEQYILKSALYPLLTLLVDLISALTAEGGRSANEVVSSFDGLFRRYLVSFVVLFHVACLEPSLQ